ncbi:MAG: hypothetical protein KJO31_07900 [Gammaproteobacteria bacterium]|nr:hypothetical protein [Gammaproteobacteria bacterium]
MSDRRVCKMNTVMLIVSGILALFSSTSLAVTLDCYWAAERSVTIDNGWIDVVQGADENHHNARVAIWGTERINARCLDLDRDHDAEVVVWSRGVGSGPYYRLQIIDFLPDGILSWSYSSDGMPIIKDRHIHLGNLAGRYQEPGAEPTYKSYPYNKKYGLWDSDKVYVWMQFITVLTEGKSVYLLGNEFESSMACKASGELTVTKFSSAGLEASYRCQSNVDVRDALKPITD